MAYRTPMANVELSQERSLRTGFCVLSHPNTRKEEKKGKGMKGIGSHFHF